jgi:hypothetical protein
MLKSLFLLIVFISTSAFGQVSQEICQDINFPMPGCMAIVPIIVPSKQMEPLAEELLNSPVTLDCGLRIVENTVGGIKHELTERDTEALEYMCSEALSAYFSFAKEHWLTPRHPERQFVWKISFIPDSKEYRGLNDNKYRFSTRVGSARNLAGYTDILKKHTFMISSTSMKHDSEFRVTFIHELFHGLSFFYGTDGKSANNKIIVQQERLAREFTERLGYGQ